MLERVNIAVDAIASEIQKMSLDIHDNPELGNQEFKACSLQTELLKKYGFEVETPFCNLETAYKACYKGKKQGPKIAMLSEYDALPGIGHACGHNLIAMVGVGAGIAMQEFADEFGGEIYIFGTPAEETTGAKMAMSDAGVFDEMDVAMMSHPGAVYIESVSTLAVDTFKVAFHGRTSHAAAAPEAGINALDAVINFFNLINAFRQQMRSDGRIHGIIVNGGEAANVIPDYTEAKIFVRAGKIDYLEKLSQRVEDCAKAAALGTGCSLEFERTQPTMLDTNSSRYLNALNTAQMKKLGIDMIPAPEGAQAGSSDMGNVTYRCPGIQNSFNIFESGNAAPYHTKEFAKAAADQLGFDNALLTIKGHVLTAIELMKNPQHLDAIHAEFEKISRRPKQ